MNDIENIARNISLETFENFDISRFINDNAYMLKEFIGYFYESHKDINRVWNLNNWDVSKITDMSYLFYNLQSIEALFIDNWNVSNVVNMNFMFYNCKCLRYVDISKWDISNVVNNKQYMFNHCDKLQLNERMKYYVTVNNILY